MEFINCPHCGDLATNDGEYVLEMVQCPNCSELFQMPLLNSPQSSFRTTRSRSRRQKSGGSAFGGLVVGLISGIVIGLALSDKVALLDFAKLVPDLGGYRIGLAVKTAMPWMMWVAVAHLALFFLSLIMQSLTGGGRSRRYSRA